MVTVPKKWFWSWRILGVIIVLFIWLMASSPVYAARLSNRTVSISTSQPSATASHLFSFNTETLGVIGSIQFEYCDSPLFDVACVAPSGFNASGAVLASQTGVTGFGLHPDSTANKLIISRLPAVAIPQAVTYEFSNLINPDDITVTSFVRISVYTSDDASGTPVDDGSVAFQVTSGLGAQAYVPPYLRFCVAVTVSLDCTSATGNFIDLGELSPSSTKAATTQFGGATNDPTGYIIYLLGGTMTSGNSEVPAVTTAQASSANTGQFGINLRDNTQPDIGQEPIGGGTLSPRPGYDIVNNYKFISGDPVASSTGSTDFNVFTVSYIVNIPGSQPPGIYNTTVTYLAMASF